MRTRPWISRALLPFLITAAAACGEESPLSTNLEPDPAVAPFVGDWDARALTLTSVASPDIVVDLIAQGATFSINVQPSGRYTAILIFAQQASTELGELTVSGSTITLARNFPTSSTNVSTYSFTGTNIVTLDGDSSFDFNLDGTAEPALAHFELHKR